MKKNLFKVTLAMAVFGITFTACKDNETQPQTEEVAIEENSSNLVDSEEIMVIADSALYDYDYPVKVEVMAAQVAKKRPTQPSAFNGATLTFTRRGENTTGNVVIDFGAGIAWRGRTHKGKVIVTYTDSRQVPGAVRTVTFDGYSINDNTLSGTKTVTFPGETDDDSGIFSASVDARIKVVTKAGKTIEWNSLRTRSYDTKGTFDDWSDDQVTLSGTANGTGRNGVKYAAAITTPLMVKVSCVATSGWFPSGGVLEVTPEGAAKRTVNYGGGACDRTATVTVGGRSFEWTAK